MEQINIKNIKKQYINALKNAGNILIEQAEHIIDDIEKNKIYDFSIWIRFNYDEVPTMQIEKEYLLKGD